MLDGPAARRLEPALSCIGALHSAETGIIDGPCLHAGAPGRSQGSRRHDRVCERRSRNCQPTARGWAAQFGGQEPGLLEIDAVVNAAGLHAQALARATEGYPHARVPRLVFAKGNYFTYSGRPVFSRLIYPTPVDGGLGIHVTLDLSGPHALRPGTSSGSTASSTTSTRAGPSCSRLAFAAIGRACRKTRWCRIIPAFAPS